jgi:SAM-dependent methyltransferase
MVYLENAPAYEALEEDLAWEKQVAAERERRREGKAVHYAISDTAKAVKTLRRGKGVRVKERRLAEQFLREGKVLDLGCGDGRTALHLGDAFTPFGIEISRGLAEQARPGFEASGGRLVHAPAVEGLATFDDGYFDGAFLRAYLEHETAPLPVLRSLRDKLRPGGRVIIKVPNFASWNRHLRGGEWCGLRFPDHVNYFTPTTLRRLVEEAGLAVASFGFAFRQPLSDNMWLVAERPG